MEEYIKQCIKEFEEIHKVELTSFEKELFKFAIDKGVEVGEDCGFLL